MGQDFKVEKGSGSGVNRLPEQDRPNYNKFLSKILSIRAKQKDFPADKQSAVLESKQAISSVKNYSDANRKALRTTPEKSKASTFRMDRSGDSPRLRGRKASPVTPFSAQTEPQSLAHDGRHDVSDMRRSEIIRNLETFNPVLRRELDDNIRVLLDATDTVRKASETAQKTKERIFSLLEGIDPTVARDIVSSLSERVRRQHAGETSGADFPRPEEKGKRKSVAPYDQAGAQSAAGAGLFKTTPEVEPDPDVYGQKPPPNIDFPVLKEGQKTDEADGWPPFGRDEASVWSAPWKAEADQTPLIGEIEQLQKQDTGKFVLTGLNDKEVYHLDGANLSNNNSLGHLKVQQLDPKPTPPSPVQTVGATFQINLKHVLRKVMDNINNTDQAERRKWSNAYSDLIQQIDPPARREVVQSITTELLQERASSNLNYAGQSKVVDSQKPDLPDFDQTRPPFRQTILTQKPVELDSLPVTPINMTITPHDTRIDEPGLNHAGEIKASDLQQSARRRSDPKFSSNPLLNQVSPDSRQAAIDSFRKTISGNAISSTLDDLEQQ